MTAPASRSVTAAAPTSPPRRFADDAAMLLVCLIWGANFTVTKSAFGQLPPLAFTALRFTAGSALLWLVLRAVEGAAPMPRGAQLWRMIWLGVVGNTAYQLGFVSGLAHSSATNTSLIIAASPAVVAVAGAALGLEKTRVRGAVGIALAVLGVAMVVLARSGAAGLRGSPGDLFSLGAVLCWAVYTLGLRGVTGMSPLAITTWTTITGTPLLIAAGLPELAQIQWAHVGGAAWTGLGYSVVLALIVAYLLWNRSVRNVGATRTTVYICVTPFIAVLVAWAALGERPTWLHAAGGAVIAAGVLLTRS